MKILFMRHGESKAQAKQIELNAPDSMNVLTDIGIEQVQITARDFIGNLDAVYASPYTRTQLTAQIFLDALKIRKDIIIDERLREIDYGNHGDEVSRKEDLTAVALKQIAGDYEIRFGRTGENKREIITRLFDFVIDTFNKHAPNETILAVSHGRAISIFEHEFVEINKMVCGTADLCAEGGGTKNARIKEFNVTAQHITNMMQRLKTINNIR